MKKTLFQRMKESLNKTRQKITTELDLLFGYYEEINEDFIEQIEEILILADIGFDTTQKIMDRLEEEIYKKRINKPENVKPLLKEIMISLIDNKNKFNYNNPPKVILIVGVNGAGKTTSIAKIALKLKENGKKVMLAAGDTFRAAAADQLEVWSKRIDCSIIRQSEGSDPASVIFDAVKSAKSRDIDVLICDTAGRLHNKINLMKELEKIKKVISSAYKEEEMMTLLVLDSTTGQNAINQAVLFKDYTSMDGIILTKLDGSSKGGFVFSIKDKLDIPIYFVTTGEKINDIQNFSADDFVTGIFD